MNPIVALVIQQFPKILDFIRERYAEQHPNAPPLTNEQATTGLLQAVVSSVAKDDVWLAAHPPVP